MVGPKETDVALMIDQAAGLLDDPRSAHSCQPHLRQLDELLVERLMAQQRFSFSETPEDQARADLLWQQLTRHAAYRCALAGRVQTEAGQERIRTQAATGAITLMITRRCQLRCSYCWIGDFSGDMSDEVLERSVRRLAASQRRTLDVQFFGGEPTLAGERIRSAIRQFEQMATETGKELRFKITTNGVSLPAELLSLFVEHDVHVDFSCDGAPTSQRRYRKGSERFEYVPQMLDNMAALVTSGASHHLTVTVSPDTAPDLADNIAWLVQRGHRRISLGLGIGFFWQEPVVQRLLDEIDKLADAAASWPSFSLDNASRRRREPALLYDRITVDCDGVMYSQPGDFMARKRALFWGTVDESRPYDELGFTPFELYWQLLALYADHPEHRRVLLNNLQTGIALGSRCKRFADTLAR